MDQFNIHEAKTQLSKLLKRVLAGETIIIAKNGKPVVELRPLTESPKPRISGRDKGKGWISPHFDDPPA
jgi:prevent-host-death family protein